MVSIIRAICLLPVMGGSVFSLLAVWAGARFRRRGGGVQPAIWPAVSVLKPVYGLEKNLHENLRSACLQDYPDYEVIFSVQRPDDPALAVLAEIEREFGPDRVRVVIEQKRPGTNGKINNLAGGLPRARHDVLVISDSDVRLPRGYLRAIISPLADAGVGFVCTPYRAAEAYTWFEKMELLSLNADFMPSVVFAYESGASKFCLGASIAVRRETVEEVGGIEALADYLVEDYEMGRRIIETGKRGVLVAPVVETMVDLKRPGDWWKHQVYWDQNTRAARPLAFFFTAIIRAVPFALLYALLDPANPAGWAVLAAAVALRTGTAAWIMSRVFEDREGVRALWLLPARDLCGLLSWALAFVRRTTTWRGAKFILTRDGRLIAEEEESAEC
ncbi:MAG: bacteriohopanetetrol glucosamine biosynthesis glycosyltransferase HpnI [Acidobacteria bacterium]|nr:bacteriohopanetetrol glucosamine biosynthesis glycosyltransferase HpnI [Acidobacteriota bacterium]